jgi:hypothetical protein
MESAMQKKREHSFMDDVELPQPDAADLRGKQSVRATFKLSARAIEALSIVAVHLGIKQKSLFDHLIEDVQTLNVIAKEIETEEFRSLNRVQKTFVISRRTLTSLDEISRQFRAPRDALVEYSIQRLLPVLQRERDKHRRRKRLMSDIDQHYQGGMKLLEQAISLLGEDDLFSVRLAAVMEAYTSARDQIAHFVEKADVIEDF